MMFPLIKNSVLGITLSCLFSPLIASELNSTQTTKAVLTLENAIKIAQANDPWIVGNRHSQEAINALSIAASTLPDPKISIGLANIAADSFRFNQEPMTQFKVGISQMFPRGDTLAIKKTQLKLMASQHPYQRKDRSAKLAVTVAKIWLDAYKAQESIILIEKDRALFEQLADIAQASYASALGKTRQHDLIRSQLELTRLDDRLTMLRQQLEMGKQQLSEWISDYGTEVYATNRGFDALKASTYALAHQLPNITMLQEKLFTAQTESDPQQLYPFFSQHPAVNVIDQRIKASMSGIDLAKQKYQPKWGVNVNYGYRDDAPNATKRSDLFSIGVSFDLPIFTDNRQDKQLQSATSKVAAVKTQRWLLLRKLIASFEASRSQLIRLNDRQRLYQQRLLPQMRDQAEASLTAYTNDVGDFSEVIRSRIAELNATIDALSIDVDRQKTIIQLNYFFISSSGEIMSNSSLQSHRLGESNEQ